MNFKRVFPTAGVTYFFLKEILKSSPELTKRFLFCENLDYETLIKRYRGFENPDPKIKESFFKSKLPIIGYNRPSFKRFEGYGQRNVFKTSFKANEILDYGDEFKNYFGIKENETITFQGSLVEGEYEFIVLNSDIDMLELYEQGYLNKVFMSNVNVFPIIGKDLGLGQNFNLNYNVLWEDMEEFKINLDNMAWNGFRVSSKVTGMMLTSNTLPQYIIQRINVNIWEKTSLILLDHFSIPSE